MGAGIASFIPFEVCENRTVIVSRTDHDVKHPAALICQEIGTHLFIVIKMNELSVHIWGKKLCPMS